MSLFFIKYTLKRMKLRHFKKPGKHNSEPLYYIIFRFMLNCVMGRYNRVVDADFINILRKIMKLSRVYGDT